MTSTTTTRKPRTRRTEGFATQGAVRQAGGDLPIYECTTCRHEVVWATSSRTGRRYLANVSQGSNGHRFYIGRIVHTDEVCQANVDQAEAMIRQQRQYEATQRWAAAVRTANEAGDKAEVRRLATLDEEAIYAF